MPARNRYGLSAVELTILGQALRKGETLEDMSKQYGVDSETLQNAFGAKGLSVPVQGKATPNEAEVGLYMEALTKGYTAQDIAYMNGMDFGTVTNRLQETGLLMPLVPEHEQLYQYAESEGMSTEQLAASLGEETSVVAGFLTAAGKSLTGKKPATKAPIADPGFSVNPGRSGVTRSAVTPTRQILGGIPQAPGLRMVTQNQRRSEDPDWQGTTDTILTSGRGVTSAANIMTRNMVGL